MASTLIDARAQPATNARNCNLSSPLTRSFFLPRLFLFFATPMAITTCCQERCQTGGKFKIQFFPTGVPKGRGRKNTIEP